MKEWYIISSLYKRGDITIVIWFIRIALQSSIYTIQNILRTIQSLLKILKKKWAWYGQRSKMNNVDNEKGDDTPQCNDGWKRRAFIHGNFERCSRCIAKHTCRMLSGDINFVVTEWVFLPQRESGIPLSQRVPSSIL